MVMGSKKDNSWEFDQSIVQCSNRFHVQMVGRFIKNQDISTGNHHFGQQAADFFTTGKNTTKFFLIGTGKVETGQVRTCIDITSTHTDQIITTGDYLIDALVRVNVFMLLVYIGYLYGLSYFKLTFIYRFQSHNQTEKSCVSCTVRTDDTDNTVRRKHKVQIIEQQFVAVCLRYVFCLDYLITQTGTIRDKDFQLLFFLLQVFIQQLVV